MKKTLRDKPTKEIRKDLELDLRGLTGDLISALQTAHSAARVGMIGGAMNLKHTLALNQDLDELAGDLRDAGENLRRVMSSVEMLAQRSKEKTG